MLDEGHVIQNPSSALFRAAKSLIGRHRIVLTGTPIQNHVLDMWTTFDFLMPGYLGSHAEFRSRYSLVIEASKRTGASAQDCSNGWYRCVGCPVHAECLPCMQLA